MRKRIFTLFLAFAMVLTLLPNTALAAQDIAQAISEKYGGGSGTNGSPYLIATAEHLKALSETPDDWGKVFQLTGDIDLSTVCGPDVGDGGTSWTPIGSESVEFTGTFDGAKEGGGSWEIAGLYLRGEVGGDQGLFGRVGKTGTVKNLGVSGTVDCIADYIGGVVGYNSGTVTGCHFAGLVTSSNSAMIYRLGGIAGYNDNMLEKCYNTGTVLAVDPSSGRVAIGGIVGESKQGSIRNCYNTGAVTGKGASAGGIAGNFYDGINVKIENCYNIGMMNEGTSGGAIVGTNYYGTVTNCYYLTDCVVKVGTFGTALAKRDFAVQGSFAKWDFTDTWKMGMDADGNAIRPVLRDIEEKDIQPFPHYGGGSGTADSPYLIASVDHLLELLNTKGDWGSDFKLIQDLDLSEVCGPEIGEDGTSWTPLGNEDLPFTGTFDGAKEDGGSHEITGLYIYVKEGSEQGLFGHVGKGGAVRNLKVDSSVSSMKNVGGIVGWNEGTVENCLHTGDVTGYRSGSSIGGVVGQNSSGGIVKNCHNFDDVTGALYKCGSVGGVVGYSCDSGSAVINCSNSGNLTTDGNGLGGVVGTVRDSDVEGCSNTGDLECPDPYGLYYAGGIVGQLGGYRGTVKNCRNTGNVQAQQTVGGIAGGGSGDIEGCYNSGYVRGDTTGTGYAGGIVGNGDLITVKNCYNTGNVDSRVHSWNNQNAAGGIAGDTGGTVENCYNTGNVTATGGSPIYHGGIVGLKSTNAVVQNCYYLQDTAPVGVGGFADSSGDAEGYTESKTVTEFAEQNTFAQWDFTDVWEMGMDEDGNPVRPILKENREEKVLPILKCGCHEECSCAEGCKCMRGFCECKDCPGNTSTYFPDPRYAGGVGTSNDPYLIETVEQLQALAAEVDGGNKYKNVTFQLIRDLDLSEVCGPEVGEDGTNWTPIGCNTDEEPFYYPFCGTFDGGNHKISGLYINTETGDYQGLFGYVSGNARIRNLTVEGSVAGDWYVGGIVGYHSGDTVENCSYTGDVSGTRCVGGIVGKSFQVTVTDCSNAGNVASVNDAMSEVGGIVGDNDRGTVIRCSNTGNVTGTSTLVGGIAGNNERGTVTGCSNAGGISTESGITGGVAGKNEYGTVDQCFNTGNVTGAENSQSVGGVVGWSENGAVTNSYNTGNVTDDGRFVGGVVGNNSQNTVENCYNIGVVKGNSYGAYVGGIAGRNNGVSAVKSNYYLKGKASGGLVGDDVAGQAEKLTVNGFQLTASFVDWDFTGIWEMGTNEAGKPVRPVLTANKEEPLQSLIMCGCQNCDSEKCTCTGTCTGNSCACSGCSGKPDDSGSGGNQGGGDQGGGNQGGNSGGDNGGGGSGDDGSGGGGVGDDTPSDIHFVDVPSGEYYYDAVYWAAGKDIVAGTSPTTFSPNQNCTRAQIVSFLWRAANRPAPKTTVNPFTDVKPGDYYYKAVLWAYENKIVAGTSATTFSPNQNCTRAQTVTFLWRYNGSPAVSGGSKFSDVPTDAYYAKAVTWATSKGIVYGTSADKFSPANTCTRAQSVTFLYRNLQGAR